MSYHRPAPPPLQQQPIPVYVVATAPPRTGGELMSGIVAAMGLFAFMLSSLMLLGSLAKAIETPRSQAPPSPATPAWTLVWLYSGRTWLDYLRGRL